MRVPKPKSFDAVLEIAATAAMGDFDRARPLWELTLVEGLPQGRAALVLKVHHSMSDGVGGMKLLLMLFDLEPEPPDAGPDPEPEILPSYTPANLVAHGVEWQARRTADTAAGVAGGALGVRRCALGRAAVDRARRANSRIGREVPRARRRRRCLPSSRRAQPRSTRWRPSTCRSTT